MKTPFITKEKAEEIIKQYPTPFHIYDEKGIRQRARDLYKAFSWNKGFKEYFAVKATPNPFILKILKEEGCGVDCSSLTELMMSDCCGFSGSDIMFSSNVTPKADFLKARELGAYINLDDFTHIDYLDDLCGIPETICCRFNPGGHFEIETQIMDNPGEAKYGFTREQLFEGFKILQQKGAKHFGLHAFLASNTVSNAYYPKLARILFELAVELHEKTGADIKFVNLSGGVGIAYEPDKPQNDIFAIGEGVRKAFEDIMVPAGLGDVAIFTELGRYMLAPFGHLVATCTHHKHTYKGISDESLERVCKACGLDKFVHTLPNGFDTVLSESVAISAGQKQLLTIARAMLQNAPMLILDEATSSVDTRTELLIQRAMDKLTKGRTSFVIAHRLSTIKNADLILVMRDGDVIESGNHETLMAKGGFYAELYNSQFDQAS